MSETIEVRVPDIGDFQDVPVIEVLVKSGDRVKKNDSLITLESEKASMEVPAEADGVVQDVKVKVGDKVSRGAPILVLGVEGGEKAATPVAQPAAPEQRKAEAPASQARAEQPRAEQPRAKPA
jgi:pyruvate/2-oxoglutarate dehydrogenase complex dihydrolipoamide acyltransferase (E2) component